MRLRLSSTLAALALALAAGAAHADTPGKASGRDCFLSNNWRNWTVSPSGDTLYLRVNVNDVFQVDLTPHSNVRKYPGSFLVNRVRGSNWICSALDLDLTLSNSTGMRQPIIARSLRRLTPQEVAALPRRLRP
jgi:hypothetical protein